MSVDTSIEAGIAEEVIEVEEEQPAPTEISEPVTGISPATFVNRIEDAAEEVIEEVEHDLESAYDFVANGIRGIRIP